MNIPIQAWHRRLDNVLENPGKAGMPLTFWQILKMSPLLYRFIRNEKMFKDAGISSMSVMNRKNPVGVFGVPLGGMGGGSIGRGWRGDFRRWTIRPGFIHHQSVCADQFSLFVQPEGGEPSATTLSPVKPDDGTLNSWNWGLDPACATYHGLFPRAWTTYENPLPGVRLTCKQVSPVIPHNYKESSFPVAVFEWTVENTSKKAATIGLMFTWQNGIGEKNDSAGGHRNKPFQLEVTSQKKVTGIALKHIHRQKKVLPLGQKATGPLPIIEDPLTYAIAAQQGKDVKVTTLARFKADGSGSEIWNLFAQTGGLDNGKDDTPSSAGESIGAGVAATVHLKPGKTVTIVFSLAWDMPVVHSGQGTPYTRRYTAFYGNKGNAAPEIARDAIVHYTGWERRIDAWQHPILKDGSLPDWYKCALFNELYYVVEGGVFWGYAARQKTGEKEMGHYWYLEGHEYRMVNTYDVHFYASIAFAMLWPRIELSITRDFARATLEENLTLFPMAHENKPVPRKVRGAVPHDLGWPEEDPYRMLNGYNMHDSGKWKDLNPKFVLMAYRDYLLTGDRAFVKEVFPAVKHAMHYMLQYDRDGDGLIENDKFPPDQTYDAWSVEGPSAYTGGLWLASLSAASVIARISGDKPLAKKYLEMFSRGQSAYDSLLWNGSYFNYDGSLSRQHDSIMSDQLAGQWFTRMCDLPRVADVNKTRSALKVIYDKNVMGIEDGSLGAMNGVRPDGSIDRTSIQSQEVWSGTTYALAATMLQEGMTEEAFKTARGVYETTYERMGYWYATPEAWYKDGSYRSITYMRPLAIWAMQYSWEHRKKVMRNK